MPEGRILASLLNDQRMNRLLEGEALAKSPAEAYALGDMLDDVRHGVWSEIAEAHPKADAYRRALQNTYLAQMDRKVNPPPATPPPPGFPAALLSLIAPLSEDGRSQVRGQLVALKAEIHAAIGKTTDRETRLHFEAAEHRIGVILDPKK